jgi:sugar transferase (PEP-CTERM/EpsH1 system associated)
MQTPSEISSTVPHPSMPSATSRLRIVALTHRVPFPPDKGDKIRTWHLLSRLAQRAEVHLACLADPPEDVRYAEGLRDVFASVTVVPISMRSQKLRALPYVASRTPLTLPVFHHRDLDIALRELCEQIHPDAFYAESSSMAPYALAHPDVPLVMDFVDVDSAKWRSYASGARFPMNLVYAREAWALSRYERLVAAHASISTVTAARELALFHTVAPGANARVLANGVDTDYFAPRETEPSEPHVIFFGAMDYGANVEAARYLVLRVLPYLRALVPGATVTLAGAKPTREVKALAQVPGVTVTGFVPDIRPHVHNAMVSAVPLRVARGIQNKVLEAMAMGVPVVASPSAADGIDAVHGRDLEVAAIDASGRAFAESIASLIRDPSRRETIARAARQRVVERYGWGMRAEELFELLKGAAHRHVMVAAG